MEKQTNEMKKNMGVMSAISIVVGCVIGAGVFFKPYAIYQATGGAPGLGLLSWVIGGLISIFGALTFAEIAVLIPRTGGMVTYLGEVYDRRIGFLAGWMQVHYRMAFDDNGYPMMYVFSNCKAFIRTIPLQMYDEHKPEDMDSTLEDHVADEVRYMCMDRPIKPSLISAPDHYAETPMAQYLNIPKGDLGTAKKKPKVEVIRHG